MIKAPHIGRLPLCYKGYSVRKSGKKFIFGCGNVRLTHKEVYDYIKEMEKRLNPKNIIISEQESNYYKVKKIIDERSMHENKDCLTKLQTLFPEYKKKLKSVNKKEA